MAGLEWRREAAAEASRATTRGGWAMVCSHMRDQERALGIWDERERERLFRTLESTLVGCAPADHRALADCRG